MTTGANTAESGCKPRLPRGVRLKYDKTRAEWLLLAPERVIKADAIAAEILKRCDGTLTLEAIVDDLARQFSADRARVEEDVRALLGELAEKRMVDL
jgi:pyrroloquinoline quinone biosynthesis protein D